MKLSNFRLDMVVIPVIFTGVIIGFLSLIVIPIYNQHKIEVKFPVGSAVQLKGLDIKGNVSEYRGGNKVFSENVEILVIDKYGQVQKITVDVSLLSK